MNKDRAISLVAAILTVNVMFVVGGLTYLYFKDRQYFKWAFLSLVVMIVLLVMYSFTRKLLSEIFDK